MLGKLIRSLFGSGGAAVATTVLDGKPMILLDAEDLAEQGIEVAYEKVLPTLRVHVPEPLLVTDVIGEANCSYAIRVGDELRTVYSPDIEGSESESWGRATFEFFRLVNLQLRDAPVRLYALHGGNDLCGVFLTPEEYEQARLQLARRSDWPYLPTDEAPAYGLPD